MTNLLPSRRKLKLVVCQALDFLRVHAILLRRVRRSGGLVLLNFHRISPHTNPYWNPIHPRHFDELLGFLKKRFDVVSFRDLARQPESTVRPASRPRLVLSFDDGYHDFVEYALPLLEKHGLPVNQNLIGDCVRSGEPPWDVAMYEFLRSAPTSLINEAVPAGFGRVLASDDDESKLRFGLALTRYLKMRPRAERKPLWDHVASFMSKLDFKRTRMLRLDELKSLPQFCEVGCHSFSHESMGYESEDYFEHDFARCKSLFIEELDLPLAIYAFPNGSYRPSQIEFLLRSGVEHILLVEERLSKLGPVYTRLTMSAESASEARLRACGLCSKGIQRGETSP